MYSPNNVCVYLKAFAGAMTGVAASGKYLTDTTESDYLICAEQADAFAQELDMVWGGAPYTNADLDQIFNGSKGVWEGGRSPITNTQGASIAPSSYTGVCTAIVKLTQAGTAQVVAEGINPNGCGSGGGVTSVGGTAPIVSSGGAGPVISITPATDVAAGSMSAADKTKLDALGPTGFPNRHTATTNSFSVPVFVAIGGSPTATLVGGSPNVTMSAPVTLSKGDLLAFTGSTPIPPYEVAANVVASVNVTLTSNYGGASGSGVATKTIPVADAVLVPSAFSGLSTSGYTLNYSGQVAVDNTTASPVGLVIYFAGAAQYEGGFIFYQGLNTQNQNINVPFDFDVSVTGSPAPATFQPRVYLYGIGGSPGDVTSATIGNSFCAVTQVA